MLSFLKKKKTENENQLMAYVSGKVIPIEPTENVIVSPGNGVIVTVMAEIKHAVAKEAVIAEI